MSGEYIKGEHEDVRSIAKGITGFKGNVHLSFGDPINAEFSNAEDVAGNIDQQVLRDYVLHPSNCFAYEELEKRSPKVNVGPQSKMFTDSDFPKEREFFNAHIAACPKEYRGVLLRSYANPVSVLLGELPAGDA